MIIKDHIIWEGVRIPLEYHDCDDFSLLPDLPVRQVYGICFVGGQIIVGQRKKDGSWGFIGGTVEEGENIADALSREIEEESNMEVLQHIPIGYQIVINPETNEPEYLQVRYACSVRSYGPFVSDPDDDIVAITYILPEEYKEYVDWGIIGDRIIERAIDIKNKNF